MDPASRELIEVVAEDLQYLRDRWPQGEVSDAEIRRSSTVLRRLLTYADLLKVWVTVVGRKDFIVPSDYIVVDAPSRLQQVDFVTGSPANQRTGTKVFGAIAFNQIQSESSPSIFHFKRDDLCPMKRFLGRPACIINGVPVTRNELVQFVAVKMGGAHFDTGRQKPREIALSAMEAYQLGNRPALIHEMLSYGQTLAEAPCTNELLEALTKRKGD